MTPAHPFDAYASEIQEHAVSDENFWLIIGEVSKCYPTFHVKPWKDIVIDLTTGFP